jgi:hypothetical protein
MENLLMDSKMERANTDGRMAPYTKANSKTTKDTEKVSTAPDKYLSRGSGSMTREQEPAILWFRARDLGASGPKTNIKCQTNSSDPLFSIY